MYPSWQNINKERLWGILMNDLRTKNCVVVLIWVLIHTKVINPYTHFKQILSHISWFMMADLKDVFFCITINPDSQVLFD